MTQFGGGAPRRRPRQGAGPEEQAGLSTMFFQLLPLILLFVLPLLSSLFSGSANTGPQWSMNKSGSYTKQLQSPQFKVNFFVKPSDWVDMSRSQKTQLAQRVDVNYLSDMRHRCALEERQKDELIMEAQGWFSTDEAILTKARNLPMKSCKRLAEMNKGL
jgi:DnaJ family protein B protein 12